MTRKFLVFLSTVLGTFVCLLLLMTGPVFASGGIRTYGPFASGSPDSGTCGNNWAEDSFQRSFQVATANPYKPTEIFNGSFVTIAGPSPNACAGGSNNGATVGDGVHGKFNGSEKITVTGGTYNSRAKCTVSTCNSTAGFISTVYGSSATYTITSFKFTYHPNDSENGSWLDEGTSSTFTTSGDITGIRDDSDD